MSHGYECVGASLDYITTDTAITPLPVANDDDDNDDDNDGDDDTVAGGVVVAMTYDGAPAAPEGYMVVDSNDCTGSGRESIIFEGMPTSTTFEQCWQGCEMYEKFRNRMLFEIQLEVIGKAVPFRQGRRKEPAESFFRRTR